MKKVGPLIKKMGRHLAFAVIVPILLLFAGFVCLGDSISIRITPDYPATAIRTVSPRGPALFATLATTAFLVVGCYLYFVRRRHRLIYGIIEVLVAVAIMVVAMNDAWEKFINYFPINRPDTSLVHVLPWLPSLVPILQVLVATYVFVRGLDNIGEGLDPQSSMGRRWSALFPKPKRTIGEMMVTRVEVIRPDQEMSIAKSCS